MTVLPDYFTCAQIADEQFVQIRFWRIVAHYAELAGSPLVVSSSAAYAIFDGLFQQALLRHFAGRRSAARELAANAERILRDLVVER